VGTATGATGASVGTTGAVVGDTGASVGAATGTSVGTTGAAVGLTGASVGTATGASVGTATGATGASVGTATGDSVGTLARSSTKPLQYAKSSASRFAIFSLSVFLAATTVPKINSAVKVLDTSFISFFIVFNLLIQLLNKRYGIQRWLSTDKAHRNMDAKRDVSLGEHLYF
jgi:hypothetical protein